MTDTYLGGLPPLPEPAHSCWSRPVEVIPPQGQPYSIQRTGEAYFTAAQMNTHYLAGYEAGRASRAQSEWQSMDSAPRDMADRLYLVDGRCVHGFVDATGVLCVLPDNMPWRKMKGKPTHWMPLPATLGETK